MTKEFIEGTVEDTYQDYFNSPQMKFVVVKWEYE